MAQTEEILIEMKGRISDLEKKLKKADVKIKDTAKKAETANAKMQNAFRETASSIAAFQGPLGPLSGRINAMGAAVGRAGLLLTGLGVGMVGITIAMKKALGAASDFNREYMRLEGIVKATGGAAGFSAAEINRFAVDLGESTLTSATAAREAAGIILTFKSITGDTFKDTLKLAQDMSESGFGALKQTSLQLAKALEEPVIGLNALRRSGVSFTDSQKEMIKGMVDVGNKAAAQKMILKAVSDQVGGVGVAAAQGLAGAMDTLGERVTRAWEHIGNTAPVQLAARAITALSDIVNSFLVTMDNINEAQSNFKDFLEPNADALKDLGISIEGINPENLFEVSRAMKDAAERGLDLRSRNVELTAAQAKLISVSSDLNNAHKALAVAQAGYNFALDKGTVNIQVYKASLERQQSRVEKFTPLVGILSTKVRDLATAHLENAEASTVDEKVAKLLAEAYLANFNATLKMEASIQKIIDKADPMGAALKEQTILVSFYKDQLDAGKISADRFQEAMTAIAEIGPVAGIKPEDDETEKLKEKAIEKLETLDEQFMTEEEMLAVHMGNNLQIIQEGLDAGVVGEKDAADRRKKVIADFHKSKKKLDQTSFKANMAAASSLAQGLMAISSSSSKSLFKVAKAGSLAIAGINMWEGVSKGVAKGWPQAIPAVAYALGTGLKAISSIQGASFGGGGGGGGGSAGGGGGGGATATAATPTATATPTTIQPTAAAVGQKVEINLGDEDGLISKNSIRAIIDGINDQISDGAAIQSITVV